MKTKLLIAVAMVFFASCMKVKKKGDEETVNSDHGEQTIQVYKTEQLGNSNKELSYKYLDTEKSNFSQVQFAVPSTWSEKILVVRQDGDKESEGVITPTSEGFWNDYLVSENKVNYKFYQDSKKDKVLDEVEVLPVQFLELTADLNLAEKFNLTTKTKMVFIKQLQLSNNAHLYLEDYSGQIIIQNLNSDAGFIQSYADEARAAHEVPAKSGGTLNIKILNGEGALNVVMKGQDGANGWAAKLPDEIKKGAKGAAARREEYGGGPEDCKYSIIPAKEGGTGDKGYPGEDGLDGGNSGRALIQNQSTQLVIQISSIAGKRGIGTEGGQGGDPGDPGDALDSYGNCSGAPAGGPGNRGGQGPHGNNGVEGHIQKSCLISADLTKKCTDE